MKDAEDKELTIEAVAVSTENHLKTMIAAGKNVMLASDIKLTGPLAITKTVTVVGNGHTLIATKTNADRVINVEEQENTIVLTLSGVRVDGSELERGISAYGNSALTLILDDCEVSADHYAINIAGTNSAPKVIVRNSDIKEVSGYCAFQTWSANTVAKFEGCTLMGNNKWSGNSDDFATIVINSGATNVNLTFKNCRI